MKPALTLVLPTVLLLGLSGRGATPATPRLQPFTAVAAQGPDDNSLSTQVTIEPGSRVGPIKLGDTRDRALELFPKKAEDQEWEDKCGGGTTLDWVDAQNSNGHGDLFIRVNKKGKIFQIESATTRFHTAEGITIFDHVEKIAEAYKDLRAYTLLTPPDPARGDRPLIFWIDKRRGIAFEFAYYPKERKRYLYKIIVFEPNKNICPEDETVGSPKWQTLAPYALEPPIDLAPNQ